MSMYVWPWRPLAVFAVFAGLRIAAVTHWSWWWVTSPLWLYGASVVLALGLMLRRAFRVFPR